MSGFDQNGRQPSATPGDFIRNPHQRLFVAIETPGEVKRRLEEAQSALKRAVMAGAVKWVGSEQFHLTIRFLGNVAVSSTDELVAALRRACRGCAPFRLHAAGIGFFPRPESPRVIWAGMQGDIELLNGLQREVESFVSRFSSERAEDRFHAHVTLGRVKQITQRESDSLLGAAGAMAGESFGEWTVDQIVLIRSELLRAGARYTVAAAVPLAR